MSTSIYLRNEPRVAIEAQTHHMPNDGTTFLLVDFNKKAENGWTTLENISMYFSVEQAEALMEQLRNALEDEDMRVAEKEAEDEPELVQV